MCLRQNSLFWILDFGNNMACQVIGIGCVKIQLFDGTVKTLSAVRHDPNLHVKIKGGVLSLNEKYMLNYC